MVLLPRLNCSLSLDIVEMTQARQEGHMLRTLCHKARQVEEVVREAEIEVVALVDLGHVLGREL